MDNKAQVSFEYLILIALLIIIAALVMILSKHYFTASDSIKETGEGYSEKALNMMR